MTTPELKVECIRLAHSALAQRNLGSGMVGSVAAPDPDVVIAYAEKYYAWIKGPARPAQKES